MPQRSVTSGTGAIGRRRPHEDANVEFEFLLSEAQGLARSGERDEALEHCWSARRLAKREGLQRVGEADLAIGLTLLDLDRMNEGLEAIHRAVRYFAQRGHLYLRGLAEAILAEAALVRGEDELAERHLNVAADLLLTGGSRPAAAAAFDGHARRLEQAGQEKGAARLRLAAQRLGLLAPAV